MSKISDRIRDYVKDPSVSDIYGKWGALNPDQRRQIRMLCDTCDAFERAADKLRRWIPIEERLPDKELEEHKKRYPRAESVEVIVVIKDADEATSLYYDGEYFEDICGNDYAVTHWMPLPEPPEDSE